MWHDARVIKFFSGVWAVLFLWSAQAWAESAPHAPHSLEESESHTSGLPQFDPANFENQVVWLVIVFSLLYFILSKKSLPEISEVIETRSERIRSDLDAAQDLRKQVESVQKAYEENLDKARQEAVSTYKETESKIKADAEQALRAFYARSSAQIAGMEKKIDAAKAAAMEDINNIAEEVAEEAAHKIIGAPAKAARAA